MPGLMSGTGIPVAEPLPTATRPSTQVRLSHVNLQGVPLKSPVLNLSKYKIPV